MIRLELHRLDRTSTTGYTIAQTLTVNDDNTYTITGDTNLNLREITIPDPHTPGATIHLDKNPTLWARNARAAFRTPYLVPVLTDDTTN